jgi:hypothetical protein
MVRYCACRSKYGIVSIQIDLPRNARIEEFISLLINVGADKQYRHRSASADRASHANAGAVIARNPHSFYTWIERRR